MSSKLNPWLEEKLKGVRLNPGKIKVILEVDPEHFNEALATLRAMNIPIRSTSFNTFIAVEVPEDVLWELERLPFVKQIHYDMPVYIKSIQLPALLPIPPTKLTFTDPLLGEIRISEVEIPGIPPPVPVVPYGLPVPTPKKNDVEIIPNSETKKIIVDVSTTLTGRGVKVAVIDTGATPFHPQLTLRFVELYTVAPEPPFDMMGHGQWCTTEIGGNPFITRFGRVEGIAPEAKLIHVKALWTPLGVGSESQILKAMEIAMQRGAKVVSMSLGGELQGRVDDDPECKVIRMMKEKGIIVVVAGGNEGTNGMWTIDSPGACPDALTVGAYSVLFDEVADFSSRGWNGKWYKDHPSDWSEDHAKYGDLIEKPDVIAPGGGHVNKTPTEVIYSGVTGWFDGYYDLVADGFEGMRGTSMATPHVAGLVALLAEAVPNITVDDIKNVMRRQKEKDYIEGWGMIKLSLFR